MITKREAAILRGHITRHARCEFDLANAGAQDPAIAKIIRDEAAKARKAVFAVLHNLTEGKTK